MSHLPADTHRRLEPQPVRAAIVEIDLYRLVQLLQLPAGVAVQRVVPMLAHELQPDRLGLVITGAGDEIICPGQRLRPVSGLCFERRENDGRTYVRVAWPGLEDPANDADHHA